MSDSVFKAMKDQQVVLDLQSGSSVEGRLIAVDGSEVVLVLPQGRVQAVPKAQIAALRVPQAAPSAVATPVGGQAPTQAGAQQPAAEEPPIAGAAPGEEEQTPLEEQTAASEEGVEEQVAPSEGEPDPTASSKEEPPTGAAVEPEDEEPPPEPYNKLGLFTSHGVAYTLWSSRSEGYRDGHAAYALDVGVGYNTSAKWGVYGLIGGKVGANLDGEYDWGHFGHFAVTGRRAWKYFAAIFGAGLGISGRPRNEGERRTDYGIAFPVKLSGIIPLKAAPYDMFLGIGLDTELAFVQGGTVVFGIGVQLTLGRW